MYGLIEREVVMCLFCSTCDVKNALKSLFPGQFGCDSHLLSCLSSSVDMHPCLKTTPQGSVPQCKKSFRVFLKKLKWCDIKTKNRLRLFGCVHSVKLVHCLMHLLESISFWRKGSDGLVDLSLQLLGLLCRISPLLVQFQPLAQSPSCRSALRRKMPDLQYGNQNGDMMCPFMRIQWELRQICCLFGRPI